jgi:hypothetical protein
LEVDETFILHNDKGSRNIVGRDSRKRGGKSPKRGIPQYLAELAFKRIDASSDGNTICDLGRLKAARKTAPVAKYSQATQLIKEKPR